MKNGLLYFALCLLTACGTIVEGSKQKVYIHSAENLENTEFFLNGERVDYRNGYLMVDKSLNSSFLTVKKNGYQTSNQCLNSEINPFYFAGDVLWLIAAPLALGIDFYTGGVYKTEPREFNIVLRKERAK